MKKIRKIMAVMTVFALAAMPLSAKKRAPTESELPDSYGDEPTAISVDKGKIKKSAESSADPYSKEKLKPQADRSFGQKLLGLNKFQRIEAFSFYARSSAGKIHLKKNASLIHRAGTDIGGFYGYYDTSAYAVQFSAQARSVLVAAVNKYFDDFDNKRLDRNAKKKNTEATYGTAEVYEEYGMTPATLSHKSRPKACFGYEFVDGSPYFSVYLKKSKDLTYVKTTDGDSMWENCIAQKYYFTKAQAKALATFLSDENIGFLQAGKNDGIVDGTFDEYDDSNLDMDSSEETSTEE